MIHPKEVIDAYQLMKNQWKSPAAIKHIQEQKLRKLIKHAYNKVPYYHQLFNSIGLKPDDIHSIEELPKIPILTKKIIKSFPVKHIIAKGVDINKCYMVNTSGSTGVPLTIYHTWRDARMMGMAMVRSCLACGVKPWYRIAEFSATASPSRRRRFLDCWGIWRNCKISARDKPESWIEKLKIWRPQAVIASSMTLKLLAETIIDKGIKGINPKIVISGAGVLNKTTHNLISSVFNAQVFNFYGAFDGGKIAWECPQCSDLHINSDMVILEVLKDGKPAYPGQEGEVVITNLHSYAMPFIRYRLMDLVVLSEKEPICGRPFPLLKSIEGRTTDIVTLPSGRRISPHAFTNALNSIPGIAQWRVVQEKIDFLTIKIIPQWEFNQSEITAIEENIRKIVGADAKISISLVNRMKQDTSCKIIMVSSKVVKDEEKLY
jgi:phenylacetate-CoA ligase